MKSNLSVNLRNFLNFGFHQVDNMQLYVYAVMMKCVLCFISDKFGGTFYSTDSFLVELHCKVDRAVLSCPLYHCGFSVIGI